MCYYAFNESPEAQRSRGHMALTAYQLDDSIGPLRTVPTPQRMRSSADKPCPTLVVLSLDMKIKY
jgi:hypothetical protein